MKKLLRVQGVDAAPITKKETAEIARLVKRYQFADTLSFWTRKRKK